MGGSGHKGRLHRKGEYRGIGWGGVFVWIGVALVVVVHFRGRQARRPLPFTTVGTVHYRFRHSRRPPRTAQKDANRLPPPTPFPPCHARTVQREKRSSMGIDVSSVS